MRQMGEKMFPTRKGKLSQDLLELPIIRGYVKLWKGLFLANISTRREWKKSFFHELSQAVKHQIPLEQALEYSSQSYGEYRYAVESEEADKIGEMIPERGGEGVTKKSIFWGWISYYPLNRPRRGSRPAKEVAGRLLPLMKLGYSLSEAMAQCNSFFSSEEAVVIKAGETTGRLAAALESLSRYQSISSRISLIRKNVSLPLASLTFVFFIIIYMLFVITPMMQSRMYKIYISVEFAGPLQYLFCVQSLPGGGWVLMLVLNIVLLIPAVGWMLSGNQIGLLSSIFILGFSFVAGGLAFIDGFEKMFAIDITGDYRVFWSVVFTVSFLCFVFFIPRILVSLSKLLSVVCRQLSKLIIYLPGIRNVILARTEMIWLSIVHMTVSSGISPDQAVRMAGDACHSSIRNQSVKAAELIEKGTPLGKACLQERVLRPHINVRLALLDDQSDPGDALQILAQDIAEESEELSLRYSRLLEVFSEVFIGVMIGAFIIMMYYPLITIPLKMTGM